MESKGITGTGLKIFAVVSMFIDHLAAILINDYLATQIPGGMSKESLEAWLAQNHSAAMMRNLMYAMRGIGRFAFPLYAFMLVEGFLHTRSVKKYALRLGIFALISEPFFDLGFHGQLYYPKYQNVFFTLLFGLMAVTCIHFLVDKFGENKSTQSLFYFSACFVGPFVFYALLKKIEPAYHLLHFSIDNTWQLSIILASAPVSLIIFAWIGRNWDALRKNVFTSVVVPTFLFCMAAELLRTDYKGGGVLAVVVMYLLRRDRQFAFLMGCFVLTLAAPIELFAFLMVNPVMLYNGEKGRKVHKYFFYAFYPLHLCLLYLITLSLGYIGFQLGF